MDYSSWFKIYRKRHPYTWRNKSRDDLRLLYESHKRHENQEQLKHENALEAELKIAEDKRKILSSKKGEKTFNSTCPHCFEHHTAPIYFRKKEVTCPKCAKNFVATGGLKFRSTRIRKEKIFYKEVDDFKGGLGYYEIVRFIAFLVALFGFFAGPLGWILTFIAFFWIL